MNRVRDLIRSNTTRGFCHAMTPRWVEACRCQQQLGDGPHLTREEWWLSVLCFLLFLATFLGCRTSHVAATKARCDDFHDGTWYPAKTCVVGCEPSCRQTRGMTEPNQK
ncbi:hypothetical protein PHLGIDRAFT_321664 [Phlebiopsis gigantea 11061_1 CR5-6]|uniref:Uncharacterized protein n=1 Tax=Phlebiopsis gigantea (strain 11061_1 CR5-6) TaxID=745531 RepID=A0A0C3RZI8_PHLG1|nr:hypothetical protein PHLGIDRAFT_321664 [Phlebiopsis gigantea 11061_1 CR5-6]